jgi:hypothetical protein
MRNVLHAQKNAILPGKDYEFKDELEEAKEE